MPYFGIYGLEFLEKLWYLKWAISILTNCKILRKEKKEKKEKKIWEQKFRICVFLG